MHISFKQNGVCRLFKTVHTKFLQKIVSCINLKLAIRILKKSHFSDMHYPISDIQAEVENNRPIRYQINEE